MAYPINLPLRRCSATSSGHEPNRSSSAFIRERRFSTLFPMATDSWRRVCERGFLRKRMKANLVISVKVEDNSKGGFEGTELFWAVPRAPEGSCLARACHD